MEKRKVKMFAYGAFCEGRSHYGMIKPYLLRSMNVWVQGEVVRLPVGFPALLKTGEDRIFGQLHEIEAPEVFFSLLDEFHGFSALKPEKSLQFKHEVQVMHMDGSQEDGVLLYAYNPQKIPKGSRSIAGGDWIEDLKSHPPLTMDLTTRQSDYIRRLGSSRGREIVPIDLDLYRELTKLELVADKGRRLGLTKLGKEVFRFLPQELG